MKLSIVTKLAIVIAILYSIRNLVLSITNLDLYLKTMAGLPDRIVTLILAVALTGYAMIVAGTLLINKEGNYNKSITAHMVTGTLLLITIEIYYTIYL